MALKKINSRTPSQRNLVRLDNSGLNKSFFIKNKIKGKKKVTVRTIVVKLCVEEREGATKGVFE